MAPVWELEVPCRGVSAWSTHNLQHVEYGSGTELIDELGSVSCGSGKLLTPETSVGVGEVQP